MADTEYKVCVPRWVRPFMLFVLNNRNKKWLNVYGELASRRRMTLANYNLFL